jgi:hypothetical protein
MMTSPSGLQVARRRPAAETSAQAMPWSLYLPDLGRDAQEWCEAYEQFGPWVSKRAMVAVRDLQRRRLECARREIEDCRAYLEIVLRGAPRAVATVVEINYLSTLAYYHYHSAELETAREILARAVSLIEETISLAPFLVPCAGHCYDYQLHLARIARAESRWDEMFEQIRIGRKMVHGELPLCHTIQGPVYLEDVCDFYRNAKPLNEIERETLERLSDPRTVQREYHNLCLTATVVPFIVVNWLG